MAQGIFLSQTIDVEGDGEIEQLTNASSEAAELFEPPMQGDWNATSREAATSQISNQPETTSSPAKLAQEIGSPNAVSKPVKRTTGPGKSKSPALKEREEQPSPRCASKTPSGFAKEMSSSSGELRKPKEQGQAKRQPQASKTSMNIVPEFKEANFKVSRANQRCTLPISRVLGRMSAAALLGRLRATGTNSCILPSGR